ncbi:MAG: GNAT family N-acetyltransferase [Solobacterium sp.]|jgi:predicted acetyltransferase|nr:GNAT family N-acetyltransferase [Solobacterium sp.]MCH4205317.1 GNAT family N-acetyltransferase [Solobacterium sp.]MCH4226986.1 GNAT family N-acetyltransferase [Solobacterium sp.]MCH4282222.1 GNAT family N-acetyltransferase [Solobacterium sp.]
MRIPFLHSNCFPGEVVDLIQEAVDEPCSQNQNVMTIDYSICLHRQRMKIGECDLRIGSNDELTYAGNIGYRIYDGWRGNHYAYQACLILFDIAKNRLHQKELIITCSPDNIASHKTLVRLGGKYLRTADVPEWHWLYKRGEKLKEIYLFVL